MSEHFEGYEFLAVGANCWGWGENAEEACLRAASCAPGYLEPKAHAQGFILWYAHRETTYIGEIVGELNWHKDHPPAKAGHISPMVRAFTIDCAALIVPSRFEEGATIDPAGFYCDKCEEAALFKVEGRPVDERAVCLKCGHAYPIERRALSTITSHFELADDPLPEDEEEPAAETAEA